MEKINENILKDFMSLYRGRTDRWGTIVERDGKKSGVSNPGPVTEQTYRDHLEGRISLGCYPLLDDGTVYFFAIDLDFHDEKKTGPPDFNIALKVRAAFIEEGLPVYIANSKSLLGFHLYGFFSAPVLAADIRKISLQILNRLDLKNTEIFPKQDKTDEMVKYGNYINLPYFGDSHRRFLTHEKKMLSFEEAYPLIKKIDPETVKKIAEKIIVQNTISDLEKSLKNATKLSSSKTQKAGKYPPCIQSILKGVGQGMRDIAAFTLASHYLTDQSMSPEDTLTHLERWNAHNTPPLDTKDLIEKVRSAGKGYDVGCRKIKDEPSLSGFCIGEANCTYLQNQYKEKVKNGQIQVASSWEDEGHLYEEIIYEGKPKFACYDKKTQLMTPIDKIDTPEGVVIMPFPIEKDGELYESKTVLPVVTLPNGVEEYGTDQDLIDKIYNLVQEHVDIPADDILFSVYYVLCTWVYDRLNTLSYLRFLGDVGTGKSTALDVIGKLCYKPMMAAGAVTPAPIYRIIRKFGGTLILDESDMKFSDVESDMVKILNCFVPGTEVVSTKGQKIEDVKVGDTVLSHKGRLQKVYKTFERDYTGKIISITPGHSNIPLKMSPDHEIFVRESGNLKLEIKKKAGEITKSDKLAIPKLDIPDLDINKTRALVRDILNERCIYTSPDRQTIYKLRWMLMQLDILPGVFQRQPDKWELQVPATDMPKLGYEIPATTQRRSALDQDDHYWYLDIRKIEEEDYSGKLYNIGVENDESYCLLNLPAKNCGIQRGRQVLRCNLDDQEKLISSPVYCPKVFSSRARFADKAMESRCFTITTEKTDKELPIADGKTFLKRMMHLRNQLLVWRFRTYDKIDGEDAVKIKLPNLEGRLKQIGRPYALIFKDNVDIMEKFRAWMKIKQEELIEEMGDSTAGRTVRAVFRIALKDGVDFIDATHISKVLSEEFKTDFKTTTIGSKLKELKVVRKDKRHGQSVTKCIVWDPKIMKKLLIRYFQIDERAEYEHLLLTSGTPVLSLPLDENDPENELENIPEKRQLL